MASSSCERICQWTKDSELAKVEFEGDIARAEITIKNEGYATPRVAERDIGIINLRCSGKLCVKKDDPNCKGQFVVHPTDASGKSFIAASYIIAE